MTTYTTQKDAARKGIVTPQIKTVAEKEHMPVEKMMELVAEGKVAICANKHHTCLNPEGVGSMLRTEIYCFHNFLHFDIIIFAVSGYTKVYIDLGGSLVFAWMSMTGEENPFYEYFDEILDICEEHDVTISLGDACRPGCLADATDVCQIEELVRLGELTKRAWAHNVQVMVEGPGHVPLDQVAANMKVQQTICMGAPFYVLGPLVTDIAPGYDHITAAIGGAVAAMNGAAFLCYVTPAEHLALPNVEDVKQGIIASKIAAHAADIAKGIPHARDIDDKMADARRVLDWDAQFDCALDPETAKAIRDDRLPEDDHSDTCSMCGKFCAVRSMNKALAGEHIDIL